MGTDGPVTLRPGSVRVSIWWALTAWLVRRLYRLIALIFSSWSAFLATVVLVGLTLLGRQSGPVLVLVVLAVALAGLVLWRLRWPAGFRVHVRHRVRSWLRGIAYRAGWRAAMTTAGLSLHRGTVELLPKLGKITCTATVDRVRLRMLPGQTLDDYAAVADRLAQTFNAQACRVRSVPRRPHHLVLWLLVADPLTEPVPPFPTADDALSKGVPVALAEDGTIYRLPIVGHHVLVVGATGAGKGSVLWSLLVGLAAHVDRGLVKVWAVDPKGGMELAAGQHLFAHFAHGDSRHGGYEAGFAHLLETAVDVMRQRQDRLRGVTRLHTPSVEEPLIVLVVDELAALTGWVTDRAVKSRIATALGLLLSQGRAVGVVVVGAVQDPRKDVLPMRDLFPVRIALRLNEAEQVGLVLGPGSRNRGALCDLIPDSLPGVGYVQVDGIAEPVRVRFSHVTDDDILHTGDPVEYVTTSGPVLALVEGDAA